MGRIHALYEKHLFPHILEAAMKQLGKHRGETLAEATGDVLEIGFGTGMNLPHYPDTVTQLSTVDPMDALPEKVQERIARAAFPVDVHHLPADGGLPFDDGRFDTVTVTWTLCTIPDPHAALREMRRVVKPGGQLLFIEHGRSPEPAVARWQDRLNPLQNWIGCGCNLNRAVAPMVSDAGFEITRLDQFVDGPKVVATLFRGAAAAR